jgi:fructoselysine-6-P-deglycase FrlB-like protein
MTAIAGHIDDEIASQPDTWTSAGATAGYAETVAALPRRGERVAIVGCGTSFYMAQACAALREQSGNGETDAFTASEFPHHRRYDRVIAITRSGTTTEVLQVLGGLAPASVSTVITTSRQLPATALATNTIALDFADERSIVQTRFATSCVALWRAHLGIDLTQAVTQCREALACELPTSLAEHSQYTFLGTGWAAGLANEAALKVRETSQSWAESYTAMEFRHGPISVIDSRSLVWMFGSAPPGLVDQLMPTGCVVVQDGLDPMASLVNAQRLAVRLARQKDLDPDEPRNLTRSIVLTPDG